LGRHARSVLLYVTLPLTSIRWTVETDRFVDRDPEAEAEEKVEEEKLPGVDEEGPVAIESGFATGAGDWEAAAAPAAFPAATTGDWAETQPATWESGAAAATAPATEWAETKESSW